VLDEKDIGTLYKGCMEAIKYKLTIDLIRQVIFDNINTEIHFNIDPYRKDYLLKGLDEIDQTIQNIDLIKNFEESHKNEFPWLFE